MFEIILQLHGGGQSSNSSSKWIPNEYQAPVLKAMVGDGVNGPINQFLNHSQGLLGNAQNMYTGLAVNPLDYGGLLGQSQQLTGIANQGLQNIANGNVAGYIGNETNALQSVMQNTMGTALNNWSKNGVINSSVAASGLNDISRNAANQAAQDFNSAISNANNSYNSLLTASAQGLANAGTAQTAAQTAASNVLTDSLSAFNAGSGILGTGGSTQTASSSGGGNQWLSTLASIGAGIAACFTEGTLILTPNGQKPIEEIKVGDKVTSYKNGEFVTQTVIEVQTPVEQEIIEVVCEDEDNNRHFVETTETQPFMTIGNTFDMVRGLHIGDKLKFVGRIVAIMVVGRDKVYDLKTDGNNTYIANGFIAYGRME